MTSRLKLSSVCTGILVVLAMFLTAPVARAANGDTPLGPGVWSVELGLSIDDSFDQGTISLKRHMSEKTAFRIGVGAQFNEIDAEGDLLDTTPPSSGDAAQYVSSGVYSAFLHYVRYGMVSDRVATLFSLGPVYQTFRSTQRQSFDVGTPSFQEFENAQEQELYGLEIGLGVEWFFTRRLSLGGEARLRGLIGDSESRQISRSGTGPTYNRESLEFSGDVKRLETSASRIVLTGYF
jgi:hypothetical protein